MTPHLIETYSSLLEAIGSHSRELGPRPIASHWPFVGSTLTGTLIVGQALAGWDEPDCPARWAPEKAKTAEGRTQIVESTRSWASVRKEPMDEVLRWARRRNSPFWGLSRRVMRVLEPDAEPWHGRHAWWNVYPLGWERPQASPDGLLRELQAPYVGNLFWEVVRSLQVRRVVLLAGADWWTDVRSRLGLDELRQRSKPLLAAGTVGSVVVVSSYHPGARIKGMSRDRWAEAIAVELTHLGGQR